MIMMTQPVKILFLTTWLMRGGAQLQLLNFIKVMPPNIVCVVATIKDAGPLADDFEKSGIKVQALNFQHKVSLRGFRRLIQLIRQEQPDIVFTIGYGDSLFWGRLAALLTRTKLIYSSLNSLPDVGGKFVPVNRILNRFNTRFFPVSTAMIEYLTKDNSIPVEKITTMGSGVDYQMASAVDGNLTDQRLIRLLETLDGKVVIIQVASLNYFKNQLQTLRVALTLRQKGETGFFIIFAGEGPDRPQLEAFVEENQLESLVSFPGYIPHHTCLDLIFNADIVILPSLSEGFPNILLESAVMKKPIIAADVGGIKDIVIHGQSGFLMKPEDDKTFVEHLQKLMKDPLLRQQFGQIGHDHVVARYTLDKKLEKFLSVLDQDFAQAADG